MDNYEVPFRERELGITCGKVVFTGMDGTFCGIVEVNTKRNKLEFDTILCKGAFYLRGTLIVKDVELWGKLLCLSLSCISVNALEIFLACRVINRLNIIELLS